MKINELQKSIVKAIRTILSHRDLCNLCAFNDLSSSGLKRSIQDRLESFVQVQSYNQLVLINNKIEEYDRTTSATSRRSGTASSVNATQNNSVSDSTSSNYEANTLSDSLLSGAPINLMDEVAVINRNDLVVLKFTTYSQPQTAVPTQTVTGINERAHIIRIPNMLPHVPIQSSPFYCCVVCLHPLALLIPQQLPNINQNNRITSHNTFQFSLSENAQKLIAKNIQSNGNKIDYKWQVLLRFINVDPTITLPTPNMSVSQMIPPYLSVNVNDEPVSLWDILPSNCRTKEGKRHPRPINITDKLNTTNHTKNSYQQNVAVSWWQTPGVFQYYYVGVYLERKLSVKEILDLFASNRHVNILPIEATLSLIKTKLNDARYVNEGDDDDLVVSSVLPINLSCPVGRSRIEIPLRTLDCKHLQCFDAQLFLSMNERRSIWKCPICDISATPNELFCDKYFQKILKEFKDNDNVSDINVSADGSYVPILRRNDDRVQPESNNVAENNHSDDDMIVLDSEDENDNPVIKNKSHSSHKSSNKNLASTSRWDKHGPLKTDSQQSKKVSKAVENNKAAATQPKIVNVSKSIQININHPTISIVNKSNEGNINQNLPNLIPIVTNPPKTSSVSSVNNIQVSSQIPVINSSVLPGSNSSIFNVPPPLYSPHTIYVPQTPFYATNYSPSSPAVNQSVNQKVFQISSLIQSTIPIPNATSSNKALQTPIVTPSMSSFTDVIQAPAHISIIPTIHVSTTSSRNEPIPAPINISIPALSNKAISSVIATPIKSINQMFTLGPVCTPTFEEVQTQILSNPLQEHVIRTPIKTLPCHQITSQVSSFSTLPIIPITQVATNMNFVSCPSPSTIDTSKAHTDNITSPSTKKSYFTIDRTINDVVKTLPTTIVSPIEPPIKNRNIIGRPISCPVIILDQNLSSSPISEVISTPFTNEQTVTENTCLDRAVNNVDEDIGSPDNNQSKIGDISSDSQNTILLQHVKSISLDQTVSKTSQSCTDKPGEKDEDVNAAVEKIDSNKKSTDTATGHITIPELSIDLTSDDEEVLPMVKSNVSSRPPMTGGTIKWRSLLDPNNRANIMTNGLFSKPSRPLTEGKGLSQANINAHSFDHFKPGAINRMIPKRQISIHQDKRSIDLTADDDDDEVDQISTAKKSRVGTLQETSNLGPL